MHWLKWVIFDYALVIVAGYFNLLLLHYPNDYELNHSEIVLISQSQLLNCDDGYDAFSLL